MWSWQRKLTGLLAYIFLKVPGSSECWSDKVYLWRIQWHFYSAFSHWPPTPPTLLGPSLTQWCSHRGSSVALYAFVLINLHSGALISFFFCPSVSFCLLPSLSASSFHLPYWSFAFSISIFFSCFLFPLLDCNSYSNTLSTILRHLFLICFLLL